MDSEKHTAILAISEIDETTVQDARRLFSAYAEKKVVIAGAFDDDIWTMSDEYAIYHMDFSIDTKKYKKFKGMTGLTVKEFKALLKAFILCQMGVLSLRTLQGVIHCVKSVVYACERSYEGLADDVTGLFLSRASEFFSVIPIGEHEKEIESLLLVLEETEDKLLSGRSGNQRTLAEFESYFRFDEVLKRFWAESTNEEERLFFFPIWMWWNISGILPLRPREFILTPRNCLNKVGDEYFLTVRRNRIKGSGKTKSYSIAKDYKTARYRIPERLAKEIEWYLEKTKDDAETELKTLFVTETHYAMWRWRTPYNSRYFTYINLKTCLRYFFEMIVQERYGYRILFEKDSSGLEDNEIEYLHLGDTRHIALINMIAEGATPMVAMMLAGHDDLEMSSHYYSNITALIECRTYRQYKKQIKGQQVYTLSKAQPHMNAADYILLEDNSRCYSLKLKNRDFSDCLKVCGPAGEIGYCASCPLHRAEGKSFYDSKDMYRNRIENECKALEQVVKAARAGKGETEDIIQAILRIRDSDYSYQQYLLEKMERDHAKTEIN